MLGGMEGWWPLRVEGMKLPNLTGAGGHLSVVVCVCVCVCVRGEGASVCRCRWIPPCEAG